MSLQDPPESTAETGLHYAEAATARAVQDDTPEEDGLTAVSAKWIG